MKIIVCSVSVLAKTKAAGLQELIYGFLELGFDEAKCRSTRPLRTAPDYFRGQKQTCYHKLFISIKFTKGGGGNEGIRTLETVPRLLP